jgi:hypothetical protein
LVPKPFIDVDIEDIELGQCDEVGSPAAEEIAYDSKDWIERPRTKILNI